MKSVFYKYVSMLFVIVLITMMLTACNGNEKQDNSNSITKETKTVDISEAETKDIGSSQLLPYTYKVPMEKIYVDVPNFQEIEEGLTQLYIEQGIKYVSITANWKAKSEVNSLSEAHEKCFEKFKTNMMNYQGGVNNLSVSESGQVTINGIEMNRFEGKINYGTQTKYDGFVKGYTFIVEGVPCEIIGSVVDEKQNSDEITKVSNLVDEMAKTVRNHE